MDDKFLFKCPLCGNVEQEKFTREKVNFYRDGLSDRTPWRNYTGYVCEECGYLLIFDSNIIHRKLNPNIAETPRVKGRSISRAGVSSNSSSGIKH